MRRSFCFRMKCNQNMEFSSRCSKTNGSVPYVAPAVSTEPIFCWLIKVWCSHISSTYHFRTHLNTFPLLTADHKGFCTIHSTGYLKRWSPTEVDLDESNEPDNDGCNLSCLVAVGRLHPHTVSQPAQNNVKVKPMEFVSRHAIDGKFVFVDQRWELFPQSLVSHQYGWITLNVMFMCTHFLSFMFQIVMLRFHFLINKLSNIAKIC